jgi:hypothetical protein
MHTFIHKLVKALDFNIEALHLLQRIQHHCDSYIVDFTFYQSPQTHIKEQRAAFCYFPNIKQSHELCVQLSENIYKTSHVFLDVDLDVLIVLLVCG